MSSNPPADFRVGILAWVATAAIGASWQLATRFGVTTTLSPIDLAVLRYAIPAVVLLPVLFSKGFLPKGVPIWVLVFVVAGGGLPFGLLGMAGAQFAPVSHMGALLPGSMPIFVALLSALALNERFSTGRLLGLGVIVVGVACVVGTAFSGFAAEPAVLLGDVLFVSAGIFWAVYTVAFRKSGLTPWHGAALVCVWSAVMVVPVWLLSPDTTLLAAPVRDIVLQVMAQGVLAGLLGLAAYGAAIRHLGASVAAASGAVVPALTALGGFLLLGEPLAGLTILGVFFVAIGIWGYAGAPGSTRLFHNAKARADR